MRPSWRPVSGFQKRRDYIAVGNLGKTSLSGDVAGLSPKTPGRAGSNEAH